MNIPPWRHIHIALALGLLPPSLACPSGSGDSTGDASATTGSTNTAGTTTGTTAGTTTGGSGDGTSGGSGSTAGTTGDTSSSTGENTSGATETGGETDTSTGFEPEHGPRSALYPEDWSPGFEVDGLFLQDYSYAGYHNSEEKLPSGDFSTLIELHPDGSGKSDVTGEIQAALDQAASTPGGAIVTLPEGTFRLDGPLWIEGSNIVLRGAGPALTRLWFVDGGGLDEPFALRTGGSDLEDEDSDGWAITGDGAIFDNFVEVEDPSGIAAGDDISIAWQITDEFRAEHQSSDFWYHVNTTKHLTFFQRTVSAVEGKRIYFHVPLRYPVKTRDNPIVRRTTGYGAENGIEDLAFNTALGGAEESWESGLNQAIAIEVEYCKDCWIRNVHSYAEDGEEYHVRSHGLKVHRSLRVTAADMQLERSEHLGAGGNGYHFQISQSNEVLIRDSVGRYGRHNFSFNWDFGSSGNVILRVESTGGRICDALQDQLDDDCWDGASDFHHALSLANLFDNAEINDALEVGNREDWSVGAGQTGTMNVFWHTFGEGEVLSYNQGMGYVIGTTPSISVSTDLDLNSWPQSKYSKDTQPEDFTEFIGDADSLAPLSLFEEQLARRLDK